MNQNATRAQIVALLRTGLSNAAIARQLGCDRHRVGDIRKQVGIPNIPPQPLTLEEKWRANTRPIEGGHLEWTGERVNASRTPVMRYKDQYYSPAAIAFRIKHGREPQGYVIAECDVKHCISPDCVDDEAGRQRTREQLRYLLGGPEHKTHCVNGHDLAVHVRYSPDGKTAYCEACKTEQKQAKREAMAS
ncbi:helix-turn-helix domain-containing protein [Streptomyces ipomoeae]|uniref:helix-turn-helix domain-containing protein n=1 Tax=Streptomyces ipomoeae TaxID=103232 RepID=UPI0029AC279A|nr:helix-turn-helix domain-containing protein [Streptomyces ipomoeae]MDX2698962.1 helix-turn-helix domain containing protein [Streptomyces ipomoeae]MDX2844933.1 helix-turn-helix domain containing protein [Streptomyces ipomoeae]